MTLREFSNRTVEGLYFLRVNIQEYTDEENLAEIIREVHSAIEVTKKTFSPRFTFVHHFLSGKECLRVLIQKGDTVLNFVELDYIKGVLKVHAEPVVKDYNKNLTFRRLTSRLKPSVVYLNDSSTSEVAEYLGQYQKLYKSFLSELKFDISLSKEKLVITSKHGINEFDTKQFDLRN